MRRQGHGSGRGGRPTALRPGVPVKEVATFDRSHGLPVPGSLPYGGITKLWDVGFITVGEGCVKCGVCGEHCPTGAIDRAYTASVDAVKCITCCACIKHCSLQQRTKKPGPVMDASRRIHTLYPVPKEREFFLPSVA